MTEALHDAVVAALSATSEDGALVAPLQDRTLDSVQAAAARDPEYRALRDVILAGFPDHRHTLALLCSYIGPDLDRLCGPTASGACERPCRRQLICDRARQAA